MLAVETSTRPGSVALSSGLAPPAIRELAPERRNAAELMPAIDDLLRGAGRRLRDVTLFGYSRGPGSFTGLRVAATLGRMLQSAVGCAVVAVPTLEIIARNALSHPEQPARLAVILDARRGQVFGGVFERRDDELVTVVPAGLFDPEPWLSTLEQQPLWVMGEGLKKHGEAVTACEGRVLEEEYWPVRVEHVVTVGRRLAAAGSFCRPEEIVPLYIRPPECEEVYEQRRAEARRRRGE